MGIAAAFIGGIGGLCAVLAIMTAVGGVELGLGEQFTVMFWFALAGVLLLGSIALAMGRGPGGGDDGYD
jgi:hypothetical protein